MPPRQRQKTLAFISEGKAEMRGEKPSNPSPNVTTQELSFVNAQVAEAILGDSTDSVRPPKNQLNPKVQIKRALPLPVSSRLASPRQIPSAEARLPSAAPKFDEPERPHTLICPGENLLTNEYVESLFEQAAKVSTQTPEEDEIVPSRPALFDLPSYDQIRASQYALEIQKRRARISNRVRIAIAVGTGIILGLAIRALYKEFGMKDRTPPGSAHKI